MQKAPEDDVSVPAILPTLFLPPVLPATVQSTWGACSNFGRGGTKRWFHNPDWECAGWTGVYLSAVRTANLLCSPEVLPGARALPVLAATATAACPAGTTQYR
jgi:hypothetical protein